jgi:hypothetical protein
MVLCGCVPHEKSVTAAPTRVKAFLIDNNKTANNIVELTKRRLSVNNVIAYKNRIIIFGGLYHDKNALRDRNDVLINADGRAWSEVVDGLIDPERNQYSVGTLGEKIAIVGGIDRRSDFGKPELYRSEVFLIDSKTAKVTSTISIPPRALPAVVEFRGSLYVIGGIQNSAPLSTVIRITANQISEQASLPQVESIGFGAGQAWANEKAIYVTDLNGDFWKSPDGSSWEKLETQGTFNNRIGYSIIHRGGSWYLLGGEASIGEDISGLCNDVWISTDEGKSWTLLSKDAGSGYIPVNGAGAWGRYRSFPARKYAAGFVLDGRLVVGGGEDGDGDRDDFWTSDDGVTWTQLK